MNKLFLIILTLFISTPVYAECIGPTVSGKCLTGVNTPNTPSTTNNYQGQSGTTYQYDLNRATDRNAYSIDLDAQRRDQMNNGVGKVIDKLHGQNGGGANNPN